MISSELPEVLGMSDRIMVIGGGRVRGFLSRNEATEETIMEMATATDRRTGGVASVAQDASLPKEAA